MQKYPMATQEEAHDSRNQAWADHLAGRISTQQLFKTLVELRARYGESLYDRPGRAPLERRA